MSRLRVPIGVVIVVLAIVGLSVGQDPAPKYKGTLPSGWKKIGLDDTQIQKIYKIQAEYRGKIDALEQKVKALREEERAEMEKVLTTAQKDRLRELRDKKDKPPDTKDAPPKDAPAKDKDKDK